MEENNIFDGAKFGDKFVTKDGRIAIAVDVRPYYVSLFICRGKHQLWGEFSYSFKDNGIIDKEDESLKSLDIVSKYQEPIDEEKLDKVANTFLLIQSSINDGVSYIRGFKAGYRKAKEE